MPRAFDAQQEGTWGVVLHEMAIAGIAAARKHPRWSSFSISRAWQERNHF